MLEILQKVLCKCYKKRPLYQFSDITALQMLSLLSVLFSISLPHFEIVTKFLRLLCNCMILLSCNNVNIFVAYSLKKCYDISIKSVTVHSVLSNLAKIHSSLPAAIEFWLVCLGILAYSCQNTSRDSSV